MKLLLEITEDIKYIKENTSVGGKDYYITGIFMQGDCKNRNGRIYPTSILKEGIDKYLDSYVNKKRAFGELGHPESPTVNLDRVAMVITELTQQGNNFMGRAKVLDTPMGKIVKNFMDEGCTLGVSSRALGSLKESHDGTKVVQNDFMLHAVDVVGDPSAPDAFVSNLRESATEWMMIDNIWVPQFKEKILDPSLKNMKGKKSEEVAIRLFEDFINKLGKK